MIRELTQASFDSPQAFWCDICDCNGVRSDEPQTGKFFGQNGHILNNKKIEGDWPLVVWAVCSDCLQTFPNPYAQTPQG